MWRCYVRRITMAALVLMGVGCADKSVPPPRVFVPPVHDGAPLHAREADRPLPREAFETDPPSAPFDDPPVVSQQIPGQAAFVDAYTRVGRPRIAFTVNNPNRADRWTRSIDYQALKTTLADWFASNGQV